MTSGDGARHSSQAGRHAHKPERPLTVFQARRVITMDPTRPRATAVAVRDGLILGVGSEQDLRPWLSQYPDAVISDQFADKVLMPGFIDPHLHPIIGAVLFGMTWITPERWDIMGVVTPETRGEEAYYSALRAAYAAADHSEPMFLSWGYSPAYHGTGMSRATLDTISADYPVIVLHRSTHEAYVNTPMLDYFISHGLTPEMVEDDPQVDWDNGHFWEDGLFKRTMPVLGAYLLAKDRVDMAYARVRDYLTFHGITTVGDMATGAMGWDLEISALHRTFDQPDCPVRVRLTPDVSALIAAMPSADHAYAFIAGAVNDNTAHVFTNGAIKLFADGAFFSEAMQISPPGYIDGHHGEWITERGEFVAMARRCWRAGYQIHVHVNGDDGATMVLDTLQELFTEFPRLDHRLTIEHYGYATDGISRRVAALGAQVSANPFYLHNMGDLYARTSLGFDRASRITPLGGLVRRGVPVALHSDFAMAPAEPLLLAWIAASRETTSKAVFAPEERLTLDQALRTITIDAAYILHLEDRLGSIEAGKLADFAVLEADPYEIGVDGLHNIGVWGTVYEGVPHERQAPAPQRG